MLFFAIDFLSKVLVVNFINLGDEIPIISNFFYLTYATNTGGAWSLFSGYSIILVIIGILVLIYIDKSFINKSLTCFQGVIFSMIIGGILGNIFDRIFYQKVIDFLDFRIFGYHFPIFNLADIFITVGAFIMIIEIMGGRLDGDSSRKGK